MSKKPTRKNDVSISCAFSAVLAAFTLAGCGGGYGGGNTPPAPAVTISPSTVSFTAITQGATSSPTTVTVMNSGSGALTISSVAAGGANPGDFTASNGCSRAIAPYTGTCSITVTFKPTAPGPRTETITLTDNAANSPQVINVSGTANAIAITITPTQSAIGISQTTPFMASGDPVGVTWSVVGAPFAGSPLLIASPGMVDANGNYTGPGGTQSFYATVTATSKTDPTKSASATVNVVAPGAVTSTNNVQVAQYAVTPPSTANVSVQFGLDTNYGLMTWTRPTPMNGGAVSLYVAGMRASTAYHMRGVIQFGDGTSFNDADQAFTTGTPPATEMPIMNATTTPGMTPQSGVELLDTVVVTGGAGKVAESAVVDLQGNVVWAYAPNLGTTSGPNPIKLLSNGDFLINFSGAPDGVNAVMQEVDLGGNVIWQMTTAQLNTALAAATCAGCNITVIGTHHDFTVLPNGHLIVLASMQETLADGTTPTGDVLIDLGDMENVGGNNPNHLPQPVWLWNEFTWLDTNRRPYSYPDWTHSNAVLYSKDDGNLIVSSRHQNWLIKVNYANGAGDGHVMWRLGYQGDFTLLNADGTPDTNNHDWFFAQHGPAFTTTNTTGKFGLVLFDNGDDRGVVDVAGGTCGTGQPVACFSTTPVFQLDETAMTATLVSHNQNPDYTFFGGNAEQLANGNIEFDECTTTLISEDNAVVYEVTQTALPQTVWKMTVTGQDAYRAMRIPSLYPGVQW